MRVRLKKRNFPISGIRITTGQNENFIRSAAVVTIISKFNANDRLSVSNTCNERRAGNTCGFNCQHQLRCFLWMSLHRSIIQLFGILFRNSLDVNFKYSTLDNSIPSHYGLPSKDFPACLTMDSVFYLHRIISIYSIFSLSPNIFQLLLYIGHVTDITSHCKENVYNQN